MKKLAYITAAGLAVLSANSYAEDIHLTFYGKAHVSAGYLYDGQDGGLNASSNSSRVGVKAGYNISEALELIAQVERGVDLTDGDSTFKARSSYLGLRGEWGTVRVGYYTSPTMALLSKVEEFRDRAGEGRNILRQGAANLDRRLKSSVHYQSPSWNGLTFAVQYGTTETTGTSTTNNNDDVLNTSVTYQTNAWTFLAGYQHDNRDMTQTVKGARLAAIRKGQGWRVAAIGQYVDGLKDAGIPTLTSMTSWGVTGRYQLSSDLWLRAQIFARNYKNTNNESVLATLGVDRTLSPQLTWYGVATSTQNKAGATASVTGGGYGDSMAVALGDDPFAISTGLIFKF